MAFQVSFLNPFAPSLGALLPGCLPFTPAPAAKAVAASAKLRLTANLQGSRRRELDGTAPVTDSFAGLEAAFRNRPVPHSDP